MDKPWLLFDANNCCHRMYHALGGLQHNGEPTSIVFGVLRELLDLQQRFQTNNVAFFFDKGRSKRKELFPEYKCSRNSPDRTEEEIEARKGIQYQIKRLATEYLPELGVLNVFHEKGYEADDLIAASVDTIQFGFSIIVSGDHDLYQCLSQHDSIWKARTKSVYTIKDFKKDWKLGPSQWPFVKAMAGCSTDDIPGIKGVGELTAAKFLRGEIKPESKIGQRIKDNEHVWKRNLKLVKLPLPGTPVPKLVEQGPIDPRKLDKLCKQLGMSSLLGHRTFAMRKT